MNVTAHEFTASTVIPPEAVAQDRTASLFAELSVDLDATLRAVLTRHPTWALVGEPQFTWVPERGLQVTVALRDLDLETRRQQVRALAAALKVPIAFQSWRASE